MWRSGLSARLERHLERGEELMELNHAALDRNKEAFDRNTDAFERLMATLDRHEKAFAKFEEREDDFKVFLRDQNRRGEKIFQEMVRRNEAFNAEQSRRTDAIVSRLEEVSKEQRAQREALLRLIDRFPPPAEAA
jgi:hypothetical protein